MAASLLAALILLAALVTFLPSEAQALSPPPAPKDLKAAPGDAQVSLSWSEPKSAGNYKIDYYVIYQDGAEVKRSTGTSTMISGLINGHTYSFAAAAHNSAGMGERTSVVKSTPYTASTVPGPPTDLRATAGDAIVSLSWSAPASDGGKTIDYYIVYRDGTDVVHVRTTEVTVTSLTNGRTYGFVVAAHNSVGTGRASTTVTATPSAAPSPSEALNAPTGLKATPGDGQVMLSWDAPGGAAIDYYIVYQDGVDVMHVTGTSATITGLVNGEAHSYAVGVHGPGGLGPTSVALSASAMAATAEVGAGDNTALILGVLVLIGVAGAVGLLVMNRTRARRQRP